MVPRSLRGIHSGRAVGRDSGHRHICDSLKLVHIFLAGNTARQVVKKPHPLFVNECVSGPHCTEFFELRMAPHLKVGSLYEKQQLQGITCPDRLGSIRSSDVSHKLFETSVVVISHGTELLSCFCCNLRECVSLKVVQRQSSALALG